LDTIISEKRIWGQALETPRMQREPQMQPLPQPEAQPQPQQQQAQPQAQMASRGVRIERPRTAQPVALAPKRIEPQTRIAQAETAVASTESQADDDLEIPAFLRRRAN
jgi:hypothetical protein